jgi:hypothetical protein
MAEHFPEEGLAKYMKYKNIKIMEMVYFSDIHTFSKHNLHKFAFTLHLTGNFFQIKTDSSVYYI